MVDHSRLDVRNSLGDARAEKDSLLDSAFLQTAEYRALLGQNAGYVVVGRRGTGKSAIFRELRRAFAEIKNQQVIALEPDGHEVYPLHDLVKALSSSADYHAMHEVATYLMRYLVLMEVGVKVLQGRPKAFLCLPDGDRGLVQRHIDGWLSNGDTPLVRLFSKVYPMLVKDESAGVMLGKLNLFLQYRRLVEPVGQVVKESRRTYAYLADRLDEGFRPEDLGVAFINGVVSATTEISGAIPEIRPTVFLRDNILRAIQQKDRNYTRNVEGQILRLHWGEERLLQLIAKRLLIAFHSDNQDGQEDDSTDIAVWNRHVDGYFRGVGGFRKVLELTLYRPRDIITLLNLAFFEAQSVGRQYITPTDVNRSAEEVSKLRLEDLVKEYGNIVPGIGELLRAFKDSSPFPTMREAEAIVEGVVSSTRDEVLSRTIRLYGENGIVNELHSIGFIGYQGSGGRFTFCHDGKLTTPSLNADTELMVHPCYWRALGLEDGVLSPEEATQIHDDYNERYESIDVTSVTLERRREFIRQLRDSYNSLGSDDKAFFDWARRALSVLLAGGIRDLEQSENLLHGRITSTQGLWGDIQDRFGINNLVFVLRNEDALTLGAISEAVSRAKQMRQSGVVFVISRGQEPFVRAGAELDAIRSHYQDSGVTVAYTTASAVQKSLAKLRDPALDREPTRFVSHAIEQTVHSYVRHEKIDRKKRRQKRLKCDLLLVVATEVERDAVLDTLTQEYDCEVSLVYAPRRTYFKIAGIAHTRLMLVQCEMGSAGVGASQATVRDAIDDVGPANIVMVGIAFGLRPKKQKLGDILVSKQLQAYEMRRVGTDGSQVSFSPRGDRVSSSGRLVSRLRAANYSWPGRVRFGLVLSGEKLVDNRAFRDTLVTEEPEAIGGEMEGSGLYTAAADFGKRWVIVKAICDWADGTKAEDKQIRQAKAAGNAATFVVHAIVECGLAN